MKKIDPPNQGAWPDWKQLKWLNFIWDYILSGPRSAGTMEDLLKSSTKGDITTLGFHAAGDGGGGEFYDFLSKFTNGGFVGFTRFSDHHHRGIVWRKFCNFLSTASARTAKFVILTRHHNRMNAFMAVANHISNGAGFSTLAKGVSGTFDITACKNIT